MPHLRSPVARAVLASPEAIAVLLDARQRAALRPFVGSECSVSQAARDTGERANTMLSRVRRWQRLGLMVETRRVPHRRGSLALYRASADSYFISYASTPAADLLALAAEVYQPHLQGVLEAYVRSGEQLSSEWGVCFERQGRDWTARPVIAAEAVCEPTDDAAPPSLLEFREVVLSAAEAKRMQQELMAVVARYQGEQTPGGRRFRLMVGLA